MLFAFIRNLFRDISGSKPIILGRWGYHWEKNMYHQKYYD